MVGFRLQGFRNPVARLSNVGFDLAFLQSPFVFRSIPQNVSPVGTRQDQQYHFMRALLYLSRHGFFPGVAPPPRHGSPHALATMSRIHARWKA